MDSTTIQIPRSLAEKLRKLRQYPAEAYWRIIEKLMEDKKCPVSAPSS